MPQYYRLIYPARSEPVPVITPSYGGIFAALSEPRNPAIANRYRRILAVSGEVNDPFGMLQPEQVQEDKFHYDWSLPRYLQKHWLATNQNEAWIGFPQTAPEAITEDRWHQPWSAPRRYPKGLLASATPYAMGAPSFPYVASATVRIAAEEQGDTTGLPVSIFTKLGLANVSISEITPRRAKIVFRELGE